MTSAERNVLIGGEAGQGLVTVGQLLCKALVRSGYEILVNQSYHSRIRGGHNTFAIRTGTEKPAAPSLRVDILVAFNAETVELHREELSAESVLVADAGLETGWENSMAVPFKELASPRLYNTVALGVLGALLGLDEDLLYQAVGDLLGGKHPEALEENRQALGKSYAWAKEQGAVAFEPLPPPAPTEPRMMLNGNEAIALGALAAGVKFCSFYPMTPSTSIALTLIAHADAMGCVVEQAEDEIAAINMAIGASFAGAPSVVTTSGGGFALMTEGISLAGMTETPVVVVIAQRPGPATGLPTRTEQGDLEFVLHGGHGEFPRAVFAPGSVEECYSLAAKALDLAERYQSPVFILTDQFLADSYRAVAPFDSGAISPVRPGGASLQVESLYKRYTVTEDGVSPRLIPGMSTNLVVADSDEHTADGHITEDLAVRQIMVEKRLRKLCGMVREALPPEAGGDSNPDLLLVSWGSTRGAVLEAARELQQQGKSVATLHFAQLWPLAPEQFMAALQAAKEVVCVEGNATGQFARLLRRETGFEIKRQVRRYDGLPFTPEYILEHLT